ncbi:hypothetical protein [Bacillus sp. FJAT-29937]|uniref:hypothetical protein n=1 Tax=Bacillus sp. FJAT-29937 TaxID=1720553 RepID=UPI00082E4F34|nr:hypothetical protein [Bacillus sp. FJAT-29937]
MSKRLYDFLKNKARAEVQTAAKEFEQAKTRIDPKYRDFLVLLEQHVNLSKDYFELDQDDKKLGIWSAKERGTFVTINKPYITVDGRIKMARDEHKEANKRLDIHQPQIFEAGGKTLMSVSVESEMFGKATGTIEIGLENNRGVDAYNPFANAQTSAIGRALGFLGYGLIGTGTVATADEMKPITEQEGVPEQSETGNNEPGSNQPKLYRVQVKELPKFNTDGSSYFKVLTEKKETLNLFMPKVHKAYMENLGVNQILIVSGWLNNNGTLRVNAKVNPKIEMPAA